MLKDFKKPDLNAPRYRPRFTEVLNKNMYKEFVKKYPKYKDLDYKVYKNIIMIYNGLSWKTVIDIRDGVEIPQGLGTLFIATCHMNKNNVAEGLSVKYGKKIRNRNFESDNHLAKIFYSNYSNKYKFKNREVWSFTAARQFKRSVAATYPTLWKQYVMVDPMSRISDIFKSHMKKEWLDKNVTKADLSDYNEFQID